MPWFAVAAAAGAAVALARKIVMRHARGLVGQRAIEDPPDVRTVARFELPVSRSTDDVLLAIAAELARDIDGAIEVTADAVRSEADGARTDIVRIAAAPRHAPVDDTGAVARPAYTIELTRAWTGALLGAHARRLLDRISAALGSLECEVAWHARQDRGFVEPHALPYDTPLARRS